jgi:hypothetical protein
VRTAQQYVQSPGGLWVPEDTYQEEEPVQPATEPPSADQTFEQAFPYGFPPPPQPYQAPETSGEFAGSDVAYIQDTLENAGMSIDAQGNVSLYQQGVPGLYTKQVPLKPMPLEKAIDRLNSEANSVDSEQGRISSLQDILSVLNSDFQEIEMDFQDLIEKFDDSYNNLEQFKYSERSPDENIRSIAEGLSTVRTYIEQSSPSIDDLRGGIGQYSGTIQDLQGKLDSYYQTQYDKYDQKLEVIDALERLKDMRDTNPQMFAQAVQGLGGVAAKFKGVQAQLFDDGFASKSLYIEAGEDFVRSVLGDDKVFQAFSLIQSFLTFF